MWHALRILLLACLACTPDLGRAQGTCGPVQLGAPCAQGGVAGLANSQPGLSLTVGNPIHLITGNKYQRETDLPIHPSAPDIEILRHYNALDRRSSMLGQGWALSYDTRLFHAGGRWQIVQADGSRIDFGQATDKPICGCGPGPTEKNCTSTSTVTWFVSTMSRALPSTYIVQRHPVRWRMPLNTSPTMPAQCCAWVIATSKARRYSAISIRLAAAFAICTMRACA
jgi:hypothetical protein